MIYIFSREIGTVTDIALFMKDGETVLVLLVFTILFLGSIFLMVIGVKKEILGKY